MPALPNARHESFAQALAKGKTADEAYECAGFRPHRGNAARMRANESVRRRVADLQRSAAGRAKTTIQTIADQLDEDRKFAREQGQAKAAIDATMNKAKLLGLYSERRELSGPGGGPISTVDLTNLSDDQLDQLEGIFGPIAGAAGDDETDPSGAGAEEVGG